MAIVQTIANIVKVAQTIDDVEFYRYAVRLQAEYLALSEELKQKDETIRRLKEVLSLNKMLICRDSAYWLTDEAGKTIDGPFCTKCFDAEHKTVRLLCHTNYGEIKCPGCKVLFASQAIYDHLNPVAEELRQRLR